MPKKQATTRRKDQAPQLDALGPGLHGATIELKSGDSFRIRTTAGARLTARLGDDMEQALAEECLRSGRMVIVCDTASGPAIVGALQTTRGVVQDPNGTVSLSGRDIHLRADKTVAIDVGPVSLRLDKKGTVRLEGDSMVIDMGALVRFLSARVELP